MATDYLFGEYLVLITSEPNSRWQDTSSSYVHVDWGPEFLAQFAAQYPDVDTSATRVNIGWLALQLINNHGGSAYCPIRLVRRFIENRQLYLVDESPLITLPVYMVYPLDRQEPYISKALEGLRALGAQEDRRERL